MRKISEVCVLLCLLPLPAFAQPRTAVLKVPGMTCPTCPITLKKVLLAQAGVSGVTVHYEQKQLVVQYEDSKTGPATLLQATEKVGFPAELVR